MTQAMIPVTDAHTALVMWDDIYLRRMVDTVVFYKSKNHTGSFNLFSYPNFNIDPDVAYGLVIIKTDHGYFHLWFTHNGNADVRIVRNQLAHLLLIKACQICVFNHLAVDRNRRYRITCGSRVLYITNLLKGRFSSKQIVISRRYQGFLDRFHQQAKDFIIQQIY